MEAVEPAWSKYVSAVSELTLIRGSRTQQGRALQQIVLYREALDGALLRAEADIEQALRPPERPRIPVATIDLTAAETFEVVPVEKRLDRPEEAALEAAKLPQAPPPLPNLYEDFQMDGTF